MHLLSYWVGDAKTYILDIIYSNKKSMQANPVSNEIISSKHLSLSTFYPFFYKAKESKMSTWMEDQLSYVHDGPYFIENKASAEEGICLLVQVS